MSMISTLNSKPQTPNHTQKEKEPPSEFQYGNPRSLEGAESLRLGGGFVEALPCKALGLMGFSVQFGFLRDYKGLRA